ncbi:MAG TPA: choline-sulfatase [Planctomycetes bacterium]|nr:choline-sulfatase [Planctomycetota bacterium]
MPQRHILLITTDQQRFDTIAAAGAGHVLTPHLDWMCDRGIRFTRAYADSPICGPSRHTIMTGRHAFHQQVNFNCWEPTPIDPRTTLAGLLTTSGFQTRAEGKMHFKTERNHLGFEHMELLADYYREMARHGRPLPMDTGLGQNEMVPAIGTVHENDSLTRWIATRTCDLLDTRDPLRPFFCFTSFSKPHPPFDPPLSFWQLYANRTMPEAIVGDWSRDAETIAPGLRDLSLVLNSADRFPPETLRDARRAYHALITHVDYSIGHILARLRELNLLDDTTIIFTSDHGDLLGDHRLGGKTVFLEGSAHLPFIVVPAKGVIDDSLRGTTCDTLACLADVMPTLLGTVGVAMPEGRDGLDLLAVARGERAGREVLHGEALAHHMVLEGRYKYIFCSAGPAELLFDLAADPHETRDLVRAGTHPAELARLRGLLLARLQESCHPAGKDGRLQADRPTPVPRASRGSWPGFHSLVHPNDVCH